MDTDVGAVLIFLAFACWLVGLVGHAASDQAIQDNRRLVGDRPVAARYRRALWRASVVLLAFGVVALLWAAAA